MSQSRRLRRRRFSSGIVSFLEWLDEFDRQVGKLPKLPDLFNHPEFSVVESPESKIEDMGRKMLKTLSHPFYSNPGIPPRILEKLVRALPHEPELLSNEVCARVRDVEHFGRFITWMNSLIDVALCRHQPELVHAVFKGLSQGLVSPRVDEKGLSAVETRYAALICFATRAFKCSCCPCVAEDVFRVLHRDFSTQEYQEHCDLILKKACFSDARAQAGFQAFLAAVTLREFDECFESALKYADAVLLSHVGAEVEHPVNKLLPSSSAWFLRRSQYYDEGTLEELLVDGLSRLENVCPGKDVTRIEDALRSLGLPPEERLIMAILCDDREFLGSKYPELSEYDCRVLRSEIAQKLNETSAAALEQEDIPEAGAEYLRAFLKDLTNFAPWSCDEKPELMTGQASGELTLKAMKEFEERDPAGFLWLMELAVSTGGELFEDLASFRKASQAFDHHAAGLPVNLEMIGEMIDGMLPIHHLEKNQQDEYLTLRGDGRMVPLVAYCQIVKMLAGQEQFVTLALISFRKTTESLVSTGCLSDAQVKVLLSEMQSLRQWGETHSCPLARDVVDEMTVMIPHYVEVAANRPRPSPDWHGAT